MAFTLFGFRRNSHQKNDEVLVRFTKYKNRFRYFILVDKGWKECIFEGNNFYTLNDKTLITDLRDCIVTYRNGNVTYETKEFDDYPEEVTFIEDGLTNDEVYTKEELTEGNKAFQMRFSRSPIYPNDKNYYESSITNLSNQRVQILRFGGFVKTSDNNYVLDTITGDFFNSSDFNNWYMDKPELWIEKNELVSDPMNYGGDNSFWAYQVKTESGETFWFGNQSSNIE